ncbi:MAG: hypothetical protein HON65_16145, partial [Rhodospirillales bacterium]|nr:hypothetical protein [Rhodospirillales bacterium]
MSILTGVTLIHVPGEANADSSVPKLILPKPHNISATVRREKSEIPKLTLPASNTLEATANRSKVNLPELVLPSPHILSATTNRLKGNEPALMLPQPHILAATVSRAHEEDDPPVSTNCFNVSGKWVVSWQEDEKSDGAMHLESIKGEQILGNYNASDNGRLFLQNEEKKFSGNWVENKSKEECSQNLHESRYWGSVQLTCNDIGNRLSGTWGYCGNSGPYKLTIIQQPSSSDYEIPPIVTDVTPVLTDVPPIVTDVTPVLTDVPPIVTNVTPVIQESLPNDNAFKPENWEVYKFEIKSRSTNLPTIDVLKITFKK